MDSIKIIIDTNAKDASKSFVDLSKSFNDADKQAIDLRKQIKGLKDELFKLEPGTEEYTRVLGELGGKMDQLQETTQQVRAATGGLDSVFQTTTSATASLASGFTAAMGVVSLFGGESEDLAKTFVKLQSVMAIMNGLKGFSGFNKESKKASISLKTFSNTSKDATKSLVKQTVTTEMLDTSEKLATTTTFSLKEAIRSVTAAIASNPIGAVLVAITAAITAISLFNDKAKEAAEQTKKWNDVLTELRGNTYTYASLLDQQKAYYERDIAAMEKLGASQESINKKTLVYAKNRRTQLEADREYLEHLITVNMHNKELNEQLEKWAEKARELNTEINDLTQTIKTLEYELPSFAKAFDDAFSDLDRDIARQVARGDMTTRQGLERRRKAYQDEIERLANTVRDYETQLGTRYELDENGRPDRSGMNSSLSEQQKKQMEQDIRDMNSRIELYTQKAEEYTLAIEDVDDRNAKILSEKRASIIKKSQEEFEKMLKELEKKWEEVSKNITETVNANELLGEAIGGSNADSRMYETIRTIDMNFQKEMDALLKTAKNGGVMLKPQLDALANMIVNYQEKLDGLFKNNNIDFRDWPLPIKVMAIQLDNLSDLFIKENNIMLEQLRLGTLKADEYNNWLVERTNEFNATRAQKMQQATQLITEELAKLNVSDAQKEEYRKQWTELFNFSAKLLPPDEAKKITDALWNALKQGLDKGETELNNRIKKMQTDVDLAANAWIRGKGDAGIISTILFGTSESPTKVYEQAQKQAQDIYAGLYQQYNQELEMAQRSAEIAKALYGEKSEAYQQYADEILRIQGLLDQAQIDYENKQVENAENYADRIKEAAMGTLDAVSGLAGAMASYYAEQAEQAKETYGENSEEYKKYIQKEGDMKIAQVWTDFASGVMSAWATSEQLGPIAGPILAGIQTAALLATAIASTQQIKRQTKATANGDGNANVSGLTDRVIMAEAQNTDQTAQLNADYNQGAQRVFVTVDDINSGQDANRTAVTNNRF